MKKAFTLIELLFCVVLLSIACFIFFGVAGMVVDRYFEKKPPAVVTIKANGDVIVTQGTNVPINLMKTP